MSGIEKHDLNDVIEVVMIRKMISHHKSSADFFETMLKLINKSINSNMDNHFDELTESELSEDEMPELSDHSSESDDVSGPLYT